ncbi:hypothetical protein B0H16DRAFT_808859 [Mycena metata]|uniref:Phenazine biosynthesis protein n=1 Tax=Mycena metata TaxID=1033252 RepID=A0AAD7NXM6_9AGAR|nr:hypothetical protein B0H16DRAFT_808859 [Mycena metata]
MRRGSRKCHEMPHSRRPRYDSAYFKSFPSSTMSRHLKFTKLDVFTSTPYVGNPLAIVHLPNTIQLSQAEKLLIAREFNLSETVFLHEPDADADPASPVVIDIFLTTAELPFAGHPTVGTGFLLLSRTPGRETVTLRAKAGDIPVVRGSPGRVRLQVPIDFKAHGAFSIPVVKDGQPRLADADYVNGLAGAEQVVSLVKGNTFVLVPVASTAALSRTQAYPNSLTLPDDAAAQVGAWLGGTFVAVYMFYEDADGLIHTRMFDGTLEDPATGAAASTLSGWLASKRGPGLHTIDIEQGVDMGRKSEIRVVVDVGEDREIKSIALEGAAVQVMEGVLDI